MLKQIFKTVEARLIDAGEQRIRRVGIGTNAPCLLESILCKWNLTRPQARITLFRGAIGRVDGVMARGEVKDAI